MVVCIRSAFFIVYIRCAISSTWLDVSFAICQVLHKCASDTANICTRSDHKKMEMKAEREKAQTEFDAIVRYSGWKSGR